MKKAILARLEATISVFSSLGNRIAITVLFLMMLLITVDVIGRYFFGRPTYVADELSGYALVAITFLALAQTQKLGKHMTVTVITGRLSPPRRKLLELGTTILSLAFVIWFAWSTAGAASQSYDLKTVTQSVLHTPYWIPQLLLPIGLSLFALQLFIQVIKRIRLWRTEVDVLAKEPAKGEVADKFVG